MATQADGVGVFKRSGQNMGQPELAGQEPAETAKKTLSRIDKLSLRLFEREMRSFERDVRYVQELKNPDVRAEGYALLAENALRLVGDYRHDQREKHADKMYDTALFGREDVYEYYAGRRDRLAASVGRHWIALNAVALGVVAVRKWKDAGWTLGIANGLAAAEFIIRNWRLDRQQERAEDGWKLALRYAENAWEPKAARLVENTKKRIDSIFEKKGHGNIQPEYAD